VLRTPGSQGSWDCTVVRPTEKHLLFPQESPPSVPINGAVLRIMNKTFMELTRNKKVAVNDNDNLSQQMEYARLLEKVNRFFCVRCVAAEAFLVLGEIELGYLKTNVL